MEHYKSFEEKGEFFKFGNMKIDNDKDFNHYTQLLMVQYSKEDFIFRGLSNAKYKLFNSAQRFWEIINPDRVHDDVAYDNFIIEMISKCKKWNQGTVTNILKTYNVDEKNSIAYLSFMQHFGIKTPLLDFTKNPNKALFFAVHDIQDFKESDNEIDNYFSIYYTYQANAAYEIFESVFEKNRSSKPDEQFDYLNVSKNGIILISDSREDFKIII